MLGRDDGAADGRDSGRSFATGAQATKRECGETEREREVGTDGQRHLLEKPGTSPNNWLKFMGGPVNYELRAGKCALWPNGHEADELFRVCKPWSNKLSVYFGTPFKVLVLIAREIPEGRVGTLYNHCGKRKAI